MVNYFKTLQRYFYILHLFLIFAISLAFRFLWLENIPGFNGDESLSSVKVHQFLDSGQLDWINPTNQPMSPIIFVITLLSQLIFSPSFLTIRLISLLLGILLIVLQYIVTKKILGKEIALFAALLLSCSPYTIAYSRVFMPTVLILIVSSIFIYFLYKKQLVAAFLTLIVGIVIHPTCIFLISMLVVYCFSNLINNQSHEQKNKIVTLLTLSVTLLLGVLVSLYFKPDMKMLTTNIITNYTSDARITTFILGVVNLFSGLTIFEAFVAPVDSPIGRLLNIIFIIFFVVISIKGLRELYVERNKDALLFVASLFICIVVFYTFTGTKPIIPGYERYAAVLFIPLLITFAILMRACFSRTCFLLKSKTVVLLLCWAFLIYFGTYYFHTALTTGGSVDVKYNMYRTGSVEPKKGAYDWILKDSEKHHKTAFTILTDNYWSFMPITFLARYHRSITIEKINTKDPIVDILNQAKRTLENGGYIIGFTLGYMEQLLKVLIQPEDLVRHDLYDYGGRKILSVWRLSFYSSKIKMDQEIQNNKE